MKKSKLYEEDVFIFGHKTAWGSYYCKETNRWGYGCCKKLNRYKGCGPPEEDEEEEAKEEEPEVDAGEEAPGGAEETAEGDSAASSSSATTDAGGGDAPASPAAGEDDEEDAELAAEEAEEATKKKRDIRKLYPRDDFEEDAKGSCGFVIHSMRYVLHHWEQSLVQSGGGVKARGSRGSVAAHMNAAAWKEAKGKAKALTKVLDRGIMSEDIVSKIEKLFQNAYEKNYIAANQSYMDLAIGNAKWIMGVGAAGATTDGYGGCISTAVFHKPAAGEQDTEINHDKVKAFATSLKRIVSVKESLKI